MLVNLCDYKQSVTLIANSGVQFLDFGLTRRTPPATGVSCVKPRTARFCALISTVNGRYTLPGTDGGQPEVVKPETTIALHQSPAVLDGVWLPVPFLRFNPPRTFVDGPDNWARVRSANWRRRTPQATPIASPSPSTARLRSMPPPRCRRWKTIFLTGPASRWRRDAEVENFLDQTWIDGWLREAQYASDVEHRSERDLQQAMRSFEYQAHWLNVLTMLGEQLTVPEVKFVTHTLSTPAIPVDLILDVGNTHTCGVIIEDHGDANDGLRQTAELQVRSLSEPQFLNEPLFTSRRVLGSTLWQTALLG